VTHFFPPLIRHFGELPEKLLAKFGFEACQIWIIQTHPNSSEFIRITKFSYSGDPKNQIFGYLVIRVTRRTKYLVIWLFGSPEEPNIQLFGYSGHLNKTKETKFGNTSGSQITCLIPLWP
jgi:hypothetical protein